MKKLKDLIKTYKKQIIIGLIFAVLSVLAVFGIIYITEHLSSGNEDLSDTDTSTEQIDFYYGSTDNKISVDVLENVKKNTLNNDNFTDIDGLKYYVENGEKKSTIGIDVSEFQHTIDWQAVKQAGVDFAMIRVGFRGFTEGGLFEDENFHANIEGALANDIEVGVYFFSQAINVQEAVEEARFVTELIRDYDITMPVAFDWELVNDPEARTKDLTQAEITQCADAFCKEIIKSGYKAMIYYSEYYGYMLYDLSKLTDYSMWYVEYSELPDFYYAFDMWQYTESGTIDGIDGTVDINVYFDDDL